MRKGLVKDPGFGTGNHPSEFNGCQCGSYCRRAKGLGSRLEGRIGIRTRIFASLERIRARGQASISHSQGSSLYHSSPSCAWYILRLSLCFSRNILHTAGGRLSSISRETSSEISSWGLRFFSFVKRRLDHLLRGYQVLLFLHVLFRNSSTGIKITDKDFSKK